MSYEKSGPYGSLYVCSSYGRYSLGLLEEVEGFNAW